MFYLDSLLLRSIKRRATTTGFIESISRFSNHLKVKPLCVAIGIKVRPQLKLVFVLSNFARAEKISRFEARLEIERVRATRHW